MVSLAGAVGLLTSCGVRKGTPDWVPHDAAVVRCTIAGPNLRLPKLFDEIPTPAVPTGLLARNMDPIALDDLGYERDRPVCASLQTPSAQELDHAAKAIAELDEIRSVVSKSLRELGRCRCTYARALDATGLVPGCLEKPTDPSCEVEADEIEAMRTILEPLENKLARTEVPRVHWRLSGRTDRVGRFVAKRNELIARHPGGSEVYVPNAPLPPKQGARLVRALLDVEGVVAVVRQDSGRALLVVRELDDELILDHFAYPDFGGRPPTSVHALLPYFDDLQASRYREALAPPATPRQLLLKAKKGYLIELDRAALERIDRAAIIAAEFAQLPYDESREVRELPPLLVDRVALQVPYGTDGEVLKAKLRLTEDGRRWLDAVKGMKMSQSLITLGQLEQPPRFEAARPRSEDMFLLRGQPIEGLLFAGPTALPQVLAAVEIAAPGSVRGKTDDWKVELPSGFMPGEFPTRQGLALLRERLSLRPHELEGERVDKGRALLLELAPE